MGNACDCASNATLLLRQSPPLRSGLCLPPFGYPQVYKLFLDSHAKATSKQSITRFFKPAVAVAGIDAAADTAAASGRRRK